jgi:hypothetical protein
MASVKASFHGPKSSISGSVGYRAASARIIAVSTGFSPGTACAVSSAVFASVSAPAFSSGSKRSHGLL